MFLVPDMSKKNNETGSSHPYRPRILMPTSKLEPRKWKDDLQTRTHRTAANLSGMVPSQKEFAVVRHKRTHQALGPGIGLSAKIFGKDLKYFFAVNVCGSQWGSWYK
jgi:hypothetical protein